MEFLLGRLLVNNLINLNFFSVCNEGLKELGVDINKLEIQEPDAGLGNGGLGRLAACFLDSFSSLSLPGHGCGIRYKYGLFEQKIVEGYQVEPRYWLRTVMPESQSRQGLGPFRPALPGEREEAVVHHEPRERYGCPL